VMKNVAGYDLARLAAGSLGTLGVIAEVSLKVLPLPAFELTQRVELPEALALEAMNRWAGQPLPVSATAWNRGELYVRLSGAEAAVRAAAKTIGGETVDRPDFWRGVREHRHAFFDGGEPLWRLALPSTRPPLGLSGDTFIEWCGAQRWMRGHDPREAARKAGGHAMLFRSRTRSSPCFAPLDPVLMGLHRRLKAAFDPGGILNPGRMYPEL
jgi:glycolate oxidase FAD binding subunit